MCLKLLLVLLVLDSLALDLW